MIYRAAESRQKTDRVSARSSLIALAGVAMLLAAMMGCTDKGVNDPSEEGLVVKARYTTTTFAPDVNRMILTVTAPDMDTIVVDSWDETQDSTSTDTIYFDGQRIYVRVDVPAGRNRKFVLEALAYVGEANEPTVLYRGMTTVNVFPGELSIADLALEPVVPMVRLSPRRTDVGPGESFILDVQMRNVPGASGVLLYLAPGNIDLTQPLQARKHPSMATSVAATGLLVNDNTEYWVVAADTTSHPIVDARGNATVAAVEFSAGEIVDADRDSIFTTIYAYRAIVIDTAGDSLETTVYLDDAEVHIATQSDMVVEFTDFDLDQEVRRALDISTNDILRSQLLNLEYLDIPEAGVTSWEGLQYATNLEYANLDYNDAPDLTPLGSLRRLRYLGLQFNGVTDIAPLANLKGLEFLGLRYNEISNLAPIAGLTELIQLELGQNKVRNISALTNLWKLRYLQLWDQQVGNIGPMAGLQSLQTLQMSNDTALVDISALQGLGDLVVVYLSQCENVQTILPLVNNTGLMTGDTLHLDGITALQSPTEQTYVGQLRQRGVIVFDGLGKSSGHPFEAMLQRPPRLSVMPPATRRE